MKWREFRCLFEHRDGIMRNVLQNGYRSKNIAQYVSIMLIGNACHGCFYALKREGKTIYGFGV